MKSCTECIRVDKDCAYCTDQVSCRRPTRCPPGPLHPLGQVHTGHTRSPASCPCQAGWETGKVRELQGNTSRGRHCTP